MLIICPSYRTPIHSDQKAKIMEYPKSNKFPQFYLYRFSLATNYQQLKPILSMFSLWCIIIVTMGFLGHTHEQECTRTCVIIKQTNCQICFCLADQTFQSCTYKRKFERSVIKNSFQLVILSERTCFTECCGYQMRNDSFTIDSVQKCRELNSGPSRSQKLLEVFLFLLNLFLLNLFIVLILFFLIIVCLTRFFCPSSKSKVKSLKQQEQQQKISLIWQTFSSHNDLCAVCLNKGADIQTECKHDFHLHCLANCLKLKDRCPYCQKMGIKKVKYYCQKCSKSYMTMNIQNKKQMKSFKKGTESHVCMNCK